MTNRTQPVGGPCRCPGHRRAYVGASLLHGRHTPEDVTTGLFGRIRTSRDAGFVAFRWTGCEGSSGADTSDRVRGRRAQHRERGRQSKSLTRSPAICHSPPSVMLTPKSLFQRPNRKVTVGAAHRGQVVAAG